VRLRIVPLDTIIKHGRKEEDYQLIVIAKEKREGGREGFKYLPPTAAVVDTVYEVMVVGVPGEGDIELREEEEKS